MIGLVKSDLLSRTANGPRSSLSPLQSQVDGLVGSFAQQATDWHSLASMMAGGVTYRLGRVGALAAGTGRLASVGIGLGAEVTTFEMTHRSLTSLLGGNSLNPNLWRWEGRGGIRQGLLSSLITFGSLKGAGRLAQGENLVVQHLLQDTGMVLGHQISGVFGITPRPTGSLAEQFLHAEATNLQLGAGMALSHGLTQGRIQALERGLELSMSDHGFSQIRSNFLPDLARPILAGIPQDLSSVSTEENKLRPAPSLSMMSQVRMQGKTSERDWNPGPQPSPRPSTPLQLEEKEQKELAGRIQSEVENLLPDLRSRVSVHCFCSETYRLIREASPKAFKILMEGYFTPLEREYLERYRPMHGEMPPKLFSRIAGLLAAKKAVLDLLGLEEARHWSEIQFRYGRPELSGEAALALGRRSLLMSASDDGNVGLGLALLEERPHWSGWVGIGVDLTSDRVRYTTPEQHALGEAAYKATFPAHRIRLFGPQTAFEIQKEADLSYRLTGKTAEAARRLQEDPESPLPLPVRARTFRMGEATAALVLIPASKNQLRDFPAFSTSESSPSIHGPISPEEAPWPRQILLDGVLVRDFHRLDRIFKVLSGRRVSSPDLIRRLLPMPDGYQLLNLSFENFSNGKFFFEGEVFSASGWMVAAYKRGLAFHADIYPSSLFASGMGLDVLSRHQGKGIGTLIALNELLFFRDLGLSHYVVPVGKKGGGFWPHLGFDFASPSIQRKLITDFADYLRKEVPLLSAGKGVELLGIRHSWDLLHFTLENGRPIGKEFLLQLSPTWESEFDLRPSSPSWSILRKALEKMGQGHLLPP